MSEPISKAEQAPQRLQNPIQATIYVQHVLREHLLSDLEGWRQMRGASGEPADQVELDLITAAAERLAKHLFNANLALAAEDSPITVVGRA